MARRLRPVQLDFLGTAPVRLVHTALVAAPPRAVYRALAEEVADTPRWFTAVTAARPIAGGAGRSVRLRGGVVFHERVLAAEAGERYAYRVEETNAAGMTAMLEEWRLSPDPVGTRVRWTMALDGPGPFRLVMRVRRAGVGRSFREAMRNLDRRLGAAPQP
ncbi:SRPBCC family protein [Streptomyces sp. LP05-1]|uniref:SRPBCC family protein n=1 Tax=Streptomyces pyxinae TaxID=2970734 RepID=A0ABT2CHY0_9ACTN|nr:SRPBCC family protein [Streptomyces sp. LP05-1]MCS0637010.1 SRPBCC family protein [Streptomyces sp. LP05-1]